MVSNAEAIISSTENFSHSLLYKEKRSKLSWNEKPRSVTVGSSSAGKFTSTILIY